MQIPITKLSALLLAPILGVVAVLVMLNGEPTSSSTPEGTTAVSAPAASDIASASVDSNPQPGNEVFQVDETRLYDVSYLADPELAAHAASNNVSPDCILARAKKRLDGIQIPHGVCSRLDAVHFLNPSEDDYAALSNDELSSIALVNAGAAVVMGRRLNDRVLSERWFEHAVALSGKAGPLHEWVANHDEGLSPQEHLELLYEVHLTTAALGFDVRGAVNAEERLRSEGVDLEPIRERASERIARLNSMRETYVGKPWGES